MSCRSRRSENARSPVFDTPIVHEVSHGMYLECKYHTRVWEGKTTQLKSDNARKFFINLSPYKRDERRLLNEIHHSSDEYCGEKEYILQSIVYEKCPNRPRYYTSPYNYHTIGSGAKCFQKGKNVGYLNAPNTASLPSPVPPAIYPEVPPSMRSRSRSRPRSNFGTKTDLISPSPTTLTSPIQTTQALTPTTPQTMKQPTTIPPPISSPSKPLFDLETHKLQPSSAEIPDLLKAQDQIITDTELEIEWKHILDTMKEFVNEKVYVPLKDYYDSKIKTKQSPTVAEEYTKIMACLKKLEIELRVWIESKKSIFITSVRGQSKSVFSDEKDALMKQFKETWMLRIGECTQATIHSMKNMIKTVERNVKPPVDVSEEQMRIMTIMDIRPDPETCGEEQKSVFEEAIQHLLNELQKKTSFQIIEHQLNPPITVEIYITRMENELKKTINETHIDHHIETSLKSMFDRLKKTWNDELLYDTLYMMDFKYQVEALVNMFVKNIPTLYHAYLNGPFKIKFATCYGSHVITCETYMKTRFPVLIQTWINQDIKSIDQYIARIEKVLQSIHSLYKTEFPSTDNIDIERFLNWISQQVVELHKNEKLDSKFHWTITKDGRQ